MGKMRLPFIDSDLVYRGVMKTGLIVLMYRIYYNQTCFSDHLY
jgi:hypothetical protein